MKVYSRVSVFLLTILLGFLYSFQNLPSPSVPIQSERWNAPTWADTLLYKGTINEKFIQSGKLLFRSNCVVCHGDNGRGDGESGFGLEVPPGDFCDQATLKESDGSIYWKITYGRTPMPDFQFKYSENQRWQLVAYIRFLQQNFLIKQSKKRKSKP